MKPIGKNINGYFGEKIDIHAVLAEIETAAQKNGWRQEVYYEKDGFKFLGLTRQGKKNYKDIYISAGMHGDEPAGPLAVLRLIEKNAWPEEANLWLCPCLNPLGCKATTRTNERGVDLNRDYRLQNEPETKAHVAWLEKQPAFDLSINLHEDWEAKGFYTFDRSEDKAPSKKILAEVGKIFPIDLSETIDGFPAKDGIVTPPPQVRERMEWPEAFYLSNAKGGRHWTFEASSDFPLESRVQALVMATKAAMQFLQG